MAYLKGGRRAVGEYDWLNGWQGRQEKAERFDESRRDEVERSPGIRKGFIAARGSGGVEIGGKVGFGRVRRVWRVWRVGVGSTKAWTSLGEFGEFGEFGEWGAGSAKAWTSRGRHERMGVLDGRGGGLDLGGARNFQTGAFVYPVVSQTTVSAQTPPLPVVGDFAAAKNISRSSGNSNSQRKSTRAWTRLAVRVAGLTGAWKSEKRQGRGSECACCCLGERGRCRLEG